MASRKPKKKERQIGKKQQPQKKPLIDPRYKNTFWTGVVIVVLVIFFIINNTGNTPEEGPYPPNFSPADTLKPDTTIDKRIDIQFEQKKNENINQEK